MIAELTKKKLLNGFIRDEFYSELELDCKRCACILIIGYFVICCLSKYMEQFNLYTNEQEILLARCPTVSELKKNNFFNLRSVAGHRAHFEIY
jgi:hypothetical protein